MSFILDALKRAEQLRGQKTDSLSRVSAAVPERGAGLRWTMRLAGGIVLIACIGAYAVAWPGGALSTHQPPVQRQIAAEAAVVSLPTAVGEIPTMNSLGKPPQPVQPVPAVAAVPQDAPPSGTAVPQTRPPRPVPDRKAYINTAALRPAAQPTPPTALSQPLPIPLPGLSLAGASAGLPGKARVVPAPPEALAAAEVATGPVAVAETTSMAETRHKPLDDIVPLTALPVEVQGTVRRMKVRLHQYSSLRRQRLVMIDGRQLREGDELSPGLRLEEITELGMVIRHNETKVLARTRTAS